MFKLDKNNRFRKNWKNEHKIPVPKGSVCSKCGRKSKLTVHHEPPLSISVVTKNAIVLCRLCHNELHKGENNPNLNTKLFFMISCPVKHKSTYLDPYEYAVYCKCCGIIHKLEKINDSEFNIKKSYFDKKGKRLK